MQNLPKNSANMKENRLRLPHILPLTEYAEHLRRTTLHDVPYFDPDDGGIEAEVLLLFEKPGPKASSGGGSGFISRDNHDQTAAATKAFLAQAGLPRSKTVIWNTIPTWNGTRQIKAEDLKTAPGHLRDLLALVPRVRTIILVGNRAQDTFAKIERVAPDLVSRYKIIRSLHPSPLVRASRREEWEQIPDAWRLAASF